MADDKAAKRYDKTKTGSATGKKAGDAKPVEAETTRARHMRETVEMHTKYQTDLGQMHSRHDADLAAEAAAAAQPMPTAAASTAAAPTSMPAASAGGPGAS